MKVYLIIWIGWTEVRVMKAFSTLDLALAYTEKKNSELDKFDAQQYKVQVINVDESL